MGIDVILYFEKEVITKSQDDKSRVTLKGQDPEDANNEITISFSFPKGNYPARWQERLGRSYGDKVLVTFGNTEQQETLEGDNEE